MSDISGDNKKINLSENFDNSAEIIPIDSHNKLTEGRAKKSITLPYSNAEILLLSALIIDGLQSENLDIIDTIQPRYFLFRAHQEIFIAIKELSKADVGIDPLFLKDFLVSAKDYKTSGLFQAGGESYLETILLANGITANIEHYCEIITDRYMRRKLYDLGHEVSDRSVHIKSEENALSIIEDVEAKLYDLTEKENQGNKVLSFNEAGELTMQKLQEMRANEGSLNGVTTGFSELDEKLHGLHATDLIIIAGRPGMGKTALATSIAFNAAFTPIESGKNKSEKYGANVLFFSLEMSVEQLALRILAQQAKISADKLRSGRITFDEQDELSSVAHSLNELPLFIDDRANLPIANLYQRARRFKRKNGRLDLIIIDYLQLLYSGDQRRRENKVQEITEISRQLKLLAKDLNVPVVALSQLSRESERREDKRPQLADLRESGAIEQDADLVLLLYREEYYLRNHKPIKKDKESEDEYLSRIEAHDINIEKVANKAVVNIAKNRHGASSIVDLTFLAEYAYFTSLAQEKTDY